MRPVLWVFGVILAAVACLVLGLVVLVSHPTNEVDLLAGGILAAGAGLLLVIARGVA